MDLTFWYILLLVTNISKPSSEEFNLNIAKDGHTTYYHIYYYKDNLWIIDWPNKKDSTKTVPLNFFIEKENVLKTLLEGGLNPIYLDKICNTKDLHWKDANEIKVNKDLVKEGWTSILVNRKNNGFTLSEKNGFLKDYTEISVDWIKTK